MQKGKVYTLEGSNIENYDSPLATECRRTAAQCEEQWHKTGKATGLMIWRIEKFAVVPWPEEQYGEFYNGDSYIVLNTYGNAPNFGYDVHFWLGTETSIDEAGTAAYKTVELDTYLEDVPVQHREVEGHESNLFMSYFEDGIRILNGGVDSGFTKVLPTEYRPRLLQAKGRINKVFVHEVALKTSSLNSGDVFILDNGLEIFQFNGGKSSGGERIKAAQMVNAIKNERGGKPTITVLEESSVMKEGSDADKFWELLGGRGEIKSAEEGGSDSEASATGAKRLYKLSDASGSLEFTKVAEGTVSKNLFDTNDVFVFDNGPEIFVWIGRGANQQERSLAMVHAQLYLTKHNRPDWMPITRILEGGENEVFNASLDA